MPITLTTKTGVRFEDHPSDPRPVCVDRGHTANSHTVDKGALDENPFVRIWLVILEVLRLVLAPALQLPVFRHDIEMAMPSYLASLNSSLIKERSEAVSHWASKTKAGEQLIVWLGIEPDFVDGFVFH
ncbi:MULTISPECIES: hypothetical protein [Rhizobium/Agrobacterium group]|uniref:hypothetical protein n=1 Tax=Rhizobium/Agrobacterium group TaxID=227290 RepID=UPI0015736CDF|nr:MULTISPECIES: hypothetical protein [Rhizobium/Agrobacterium group]NSZ66817.1 hypothetical protein [Agrobacterium tumefaciens]NTA73266.1 hypothetical protein [Agrobacterium tumefaciens]NTJ11937.1 hypothetical protein [Rhizobium lusitanum]WIE42109.1 hypothetical protein G6L16_027700 [Agrobacterium tumefaciens]